MELALGNYPGCLGETCAVSLLLGGLYLLLRRVITWEIPFFYVGTVALLSLLFGLDPVEQILSGGLLLGVEAEAHRPPAQRRSLQPEPVAEVGFVVVEQQAPDRLGGADEE